MFAKTAVKATEEFVKKLPKEMVMLALEAVELQERLDGTTDKQAHEDIQHKLELINKRIIQSAAMTV